MNSEAIADDVRPYFDEEFSATLNFDDVMVNFESEFGKVKENFDRLEKHQIKNKTLNEFQKELRNHEKFARKLDRFDFYDFQEADVVRNEFKPTALSQKQQNKVVIELTQIKPNDQETAFFQRIDAVITEALQRVADLEDLVGVKEETTSETLSRSLSLQTATELRKLAEEKLHMTADWANKEDNFALRIFGSKFEDAEKLIQDHKISKYLNPSEVQMVC